MEKSIKMLFDAFQATFAVSTRCVRTAAPC